MPFYSIDIYSQIFICNKIYYYYKLKYIIYVTLSQFFSLYLQFYKHFGISNSS